MILVDTSVWIAYFSNKEIPQVYFLDQLIREQEIYICGIIVTEILQGIKQEKIHHEISTLLTSLKYLETPYDTYVHAANIYRKLRLKGITIRKTIDCIIAAVALKNNMQLLHLDRDFNEIEKHCHLKVVHLPLH
jgi:predicted nucleic acid-binding protein